ncbi:MAG: AprI/Inh family metalloprotease inhibitor [Rhizobiales bacterium]|nr:AprI/Inh family metalloprotease inhibitor [Hyphomicrobiales bacterium]
MRQTGLYISLTGFMLLAACQSGDNLLLSPRSAEPDNNQNIALGPVRPQDGAPAFPQNQSPPVAAQIETAQHNAQPPGPATGPVQQSGPQAINPGAAANTGPAAGPDQGGVGENPDGIPATGDGGVAGHAGGARQGSLAQAAADRQAPENSANRAVIEPSKGLLGGQFDRQVNSILGGGRVRVNTESDVKSEMVVGSWSLSEEDGMRSCVMAFIEAEDVNGVQVNGGCSPEIAGIRSWGVFGEDLLLRDSQNSVVVRLRRSGETWVGFTLRAGIPIILSRG